MNAIKDYWQAREPKEQIILGALGVAIIVVVLWLLVFKPISDWKQTQAKKVVQHEKTLKEVRSLAGQIKASKTRGNQAAKGSMTQIVSRSLQKNNIQMLGVDPKNKDGSNNVTIGNTTYEPLMQWLYDLEYRENIQVLGVNIVQSSPGVLNVKNIRLRKP